MAPPPPTTTANFYLALLLLLVCTAHSFVFNSFKSAQPNLTLSGSALVTPAGLLQLTNSTSQTSNVFYSKPFRLLSSNLTAVSFSTTFVFSILTSIRNGAGGHGLVFALSPNRSLPITSTNPNYLGLFNPANDGNASNHIFAVEFDTAQVSALDRSNAAPRSILPDIDDNHVGIDINGMNTLAATPASYYDDATKTQTDVQMESDKAFQVWIEYDGPNKTVHVTICPLFLPRPSKPLISHQVDLSPILKPLMFAGFTSATGGKLASAHYIQAWSFRVHKPARSLDLAMVPKRPTWADQRPQFKKIGLRVGAVSASATLLVIICFSVACVLCIRRMRLRDRVEEWERDFPHRYKYADLHAATKGFSEARIVGKGGFGCVYRGTMPRTKEEIAVKKIAHNSKQGVKEFVAEVATLGNLRHRHLVRLEGWCKRSSHLLLVYEFMSNGSLDSFLFDSGRRLGWAQRFKILKEVAAGLVHLHQEWVKVVVHRDVKASNVLLDLNMTAKLGDFGLAKFYEHGEHPGTTHVVGTIGYIAPELAQSGRATTSSDVYAFGALVFEVVCGRRPVDPSVPSEVLVQDWVWECYRAGDVRKVVDQKLGNQYVESEAELALKVGLMCSQYEAKARPSMHQVARYLGGLDALPEVNEVVADVGWKGGRPAAFAGRQSDPSSSGGFMSTTSFDTSGR